MRSIRELYRIGPGPSSSHTMGPSNAAHSFQAATPAAARYRVTLYGSLAATGRGHLTDRAVIEALAPAEVELLWRPGKQLPRHPNALYLEALDHADRCISAWTAYSIGGGAVVGDEQVQVVEEQHACYPFTTMRSILPYIEAEGLTLWEYVLAQEDADIEDYLAEVWKAMQKAIDRGLEEEGRLPGGLKLRRKASSFATKSRNAQGFISQIGTLFSYALAVSEENAGGGEVVTAPTCGSCGVLPAVLRSLQESYGFSSTRIIRALATAGLIGNIVKTHGSISGAEVGCQGEVGTACAMAAAATAQLLGGGPRQIEYAAEMGLEHHLGLTCDPVMGLVQVPCIERNAVAATRAVDAGTFATLSDGNHLISLDEVIDTMVQTGRDMASSYRETAEGGLARFYNRDELEAHARLGRMS